MGESAARKEVPGSVSVSAMSGCTDAPFRKIARAAAPGALMFAEMIKARALVEGNRRTARMLASFPGDRPLGLQIVGADPGIVAKCAARLEALEPDVLEINAACPAGKVVRRSEGAGLMRDVEKAGRVIRAARENWRGSLSVKMRLGWEEGDGLGESLALICRDAGVDSITVHGRYAAGGYKQPVRADLVRRIAESVSIPVRANGGVFSASDALDLRRESGCRSIVLGRGAMGNPWLIGQIRAALDGAPAPSPPSDEEKFETFRKHIELVYDFYGPKGATGVARKVACWYSGWFKEAARLRRAFTKAKSMEDFLGCVGGCVGSTGEPLFVKGVPLHPFLKL